MNEKEKLAEYNYLYEERLGIMCGEGRPTCEQIAIAKQEAKAALRSINENNPRRVH